MSDPLSSDDGTERDSEQDYGADYESLEERIFNSQRPPSDEETRKSVRFENWQFAQVEIITQEINTSKQEVFYHSYVHGLKEVREDYLQENVDEIAELRTKLSKLILQDTSDKGKKNKELNELQTRQIKIDTKMSNGNMRVQPIPIANSVLSEVQNKYLDKTQLSGDFHRLVVTVGLSDSENAAPVTKVNAEKMCESLDEALERSRESVENEVADYIGTMAFTWSTEEVSDEFIEELEEILDNMRTEHEKRAYYHLQNITRDGD